jgi:CsoR family transcriptional regulator, copper-sensing transcriptional repressor
VKKAKTLTDSRTGEHLAAPPLGSLEPANNRKAFRVDPEIKASNLKRLRRIEGQIRGLQKMVEEDRYCADIVIQISSVQEALRSVGRALMHNHLHHCAAEAIRHGNEDQASAMYDELLELIYRHLR